MNFVEYSNAKNTSLKHTFDGFGAPPRDVLTSIFVKSIYIIVDFT